MGIKHRQVNMLCLASFKIGCTCWSERVRRAWSGHTAGGGLGGLLESHTPVGVNALEWLGQVTWQVEDLEDSLSHTHLLQ